MESKTIEIVVQGRVQGVGFRWFTRRKAQALGLVGTVCNLPDGTVRIRARGSQNALDELQRQVRRGPPSSKVVGLAVLELDDPVPNGEFEIVDYQR